MMYALLLPLLLPAVNALSEGSACKQVTSSECELATNVGFRLNSKAECMGLCDMFASNGIGCIFAAWAGAASTQLNCRLYSLPFWQFLQSCKKLGGPPDLTGCNVDHPEDNTCDAVRAGDCFYYGKILESLDTPISWELCKATCSLSTECKAWTFRDEPSLECKLFATDDRTCDVSYIPSGIDPDDCGQTGTSTSTTTAPTTITASTTTTAPIITTAPTTTNAPTTTAKAGTGLLVAGGSGDEDSSVHRGVELWSQGNSCILPSLPYDMYSPTLDILAGLPLACWGRSCSKLTGASWVHYQDTVRNRISHTSAILEEGILLVGGKNSFFSTEIVPVDGGRASEWFTLDPGRSSHCSIQVNPTTVILSGGSAQESGGSDATAAVSELSNLSLSNNMNTRQLPNHLNGRYWHACSSYMQGKSQVLIVTGGRDANGFLSSTELLDYSAGAGRWRYAGKLPSSTIGLRAAKLGDVVYVSGGSIGVDIDSILHWDPETEYWKSAGRLTAARWYHGVTEVSLETVEDYCSVLK